MANVGFWETIALDLGGKGQFRLILQPALAVLLGLRFGIADAKAGKPPFGLRFLSAKEARWPLFKQSLRDAIVPLAIALVLDCVLQYLTLRHIRPLAAVVVGGLLVWIPFVLSRGLFNRILKHTGRLSRSAP